MCLDSILLFLYSKELRSSDRSWQFDMLLLSDAFEAISVGNIWQRFSANYCSAGRASSPAAQLRCLVTWSGVFIDLHSQTPYEQAASQSGNE